MIRIGIYDPYPYWKLTKEKPQKDIKLVTFFIARVLLGRAQAKPKEPT